MKLFKKAKKGFTLVELVVVIAVIAILAAVSVGAYFGVTESAKNSQAQQEGKALHTNIVLVANDPANKSSATFSKEGLKVAALKANNTPAIDTFEEEVEAAAGVNYFFDDNNSLKDADTTNDYAFDNGAYVVFTKSGEFYTKMTYFIDATHSVTFDIVTGAQE